MTVVGDDDQAIYAFRGAAVDNILAFQDRYVGARTVVLRRNYRSLAPVLDASYRMIRFNDPDRLEVRTGVLKRLRAERRSPTPRPLRLEVFASGSEEADWIAAEIGRRIAAGARPARPRHPRPGQRPRGPDPAGPEPRGHPVAVLRARPGCTPAPRSACSWRSCGSSRIPESSVDVYALAASELYGLGGEDLTGDRQHGPSPEPVRLGRARRTRRAARDPARRPRDAGDGPQAGRGPDGLRRRRARAAGRRAAVPVPARQRDARPARRRRTRSRPRKRSATSRGSSRSSGPSPRSSPTTGRSSSRATWRR